MPPEKHKWLFRRTGHFSTFLRNPNPAQSAQVLQIPSSEKKSFLSRRTTGVEHIYVAFLHALPELEVGPFQTSRAGGFFSLLVGRRGTQHLQSRGVGGSRENLHPTPRCLTFDGTVSDGKTLQALLGQQVVALGLFLVIERWFRHWLQTSSNKQRTRPSI